MLLLITGSTRAGSTNGAALRAIADRLVEAEQYPGLAELPQFNPDLDRDPLPALVADLRAAIGAADGLLFCTPEYAGALPGSLKNLLDWTIGGAQLSGKPVGWINCSDRGAAGAHAELATVLGYADARIVPAACDRVVVSRTDLDDQHRVTDPELVARLVAGGRPGDRWGRATLGRHDALRRRRLPAVQHLTHEIEMRSHWA